MTLEIHTAKLLGWLAISRSRPQLFSYAKLKDEASWQLDFLPGSRAVLLRGQEVERRQGMTHSGSVSLLGSTLCPRWQSVFFFLPDLGSKSPHRARGTAARVPLWALYLLAVSYFSDGMVLSSLLVFRALCEPSN